MPNISNAYLTVMPRLASTAVLDREVKKMADKAGTTAAKAFNDSMESGVKKGDAGEDAGKKFSRDVQGKLRDERGRFTKAGQDAGEAMGKGVKRGADGSTSAVTQSGKKLGGSFASGFGSMVKGLVAVYLGSKLVSGLGDSIRAASDLQETMSKTKNVFKTNAQSVIDWSKSSVDSFGLSQNAALSAASQFGDMFAQLGASTTESAKLSQQVVKLAADLGSFHNLDTAETLDLISSAMRGEFDSIQKILPAISDQRVKTEALTMTGKENEKQLTAQDKAMAALKIITDDSVNATDDFAETSESLANQQKKLAGRIENTKGKIGEALLPIMTSIVDYMNDKAIPAFDAFFGGVMGKTSTDVAGMDNIILKGEDMGLMANQGASEFEGWRSAGKDLRDIFQGIGDAMATIVGAYNSNPEAFQVLGGLIIAATGLAKAVGAVTAFGGAMKGLGFLLSPVGLAIAAIVATIASVFIVIDNVRKSGVIEGLRDSFNQAFKFIQNTALRPFIAAFNFGMDMISKTVNFVKENWSGFWTAIINGAKQVGSAVSGFTSSVLNSFNWVTQILDFVGKNWDNFKNAVIRGAKEVGHFFSVIFIATINFFATQFKQIFDWVFNVISNGWTWLIGIFLKVKHVLEVVFVTALNFVLNAAKIVWNGIVNGFKFLATTIDTVFATIKTVIGNAWSWLKTKVFSPIVTFVGTTIPSIFTKMKDKVTGVWNGLKDALGKTWDKIMDTGRNSINNIGKFINKIINAINKIPFVKLGLLPEPLIAAPTKKAVGGHVTGGRPGTDTVPAFGPGGKPYLLDNGEHILTRKEVARMGGQAGVYAFRRDLMSPGGLPEKYADGGHIRDGKYRPGMGDLGMTGALTKLYRKFGGKGNYTSGYRPNGSDWHGSGLAADFGGFNQDKVAANLQAKGEGLLELIHSTNIANYGVSRGRNHNFGQPLWDQHKNHVHVASTPEAISALLGGDNPYGPAGGGGADIFSWITSGPGKIAKSLLKTAIRKLKEVLPTGDGAVPSTLRGIGLGIPEKALAYFEDKGSNAPFSGTSGRRGGDGDWSTMLQAYAQAKSMNASNKVLLALFEAGFVESNFRNLTTAVDHDSLGFLQQRPSMGWPDPTNVRVATRSFVSRAKQKEDNYSTAGKLAQAVQVSAFPSRYDEARGRAISALQKIWPSYVAGNYAKGGAVYDQGGWLKDGYAAINTGGKPEAVLTPEESKGLKNIGAGELLDKLDQLIDAVERVAPGVGSEINGASRSAMLRGRRG